MAFPAGLYLLAGALALNAPVVTQPDSGGLLCSTSVTFEGTAGVSLGTDTVIVDAGVSVVTGAVSSKGDWSVVLVVPDGGFYVAGVIETEDVLTVVTTSAKATVPFEVETLPPDFSVIQPSSAEQTYVTDAPLFSGTSSRANARVTVTLNDLLNHDAGSASSITSDGGAWSVTPMLSSGVNGVYEAQITINSNDVCDLSSSTTSTFVTIDTVPASITSPDAGSALNSSTVVLAGDGAPGTQVLISVNGSPAGAVAVSDAGTWTDTLDVSEGAATVSVQDEDAVGGTSSASEDSFSVYLTHILSPTEGQSVPPNVTIAGSAAPSTHIDLTISADGGPIAVSVPVEPDGGWSYPATLEVGSHSATAIDLDVNSVVGSSDSVSFIVVEGGSSSVASTGPSSSSSSSSSAASSSSSSSSSAASSSSASSSASGPSSGGASSSSSSSSGAQSSAMSASSSSAASASSTSSATSSRASGGTTAKGSTAKAASATGSSSSRSVGGSSSVGSTGRSTGRSSARSSSSGSRTGGSPSSSASTSTSTSSGAATTTSSTSSSSSGSVVQTTATNGSSTGAGTSASAVATSGSTGSSGASTSAQASSSASGSMGTTSGATTTRSSAASSSSSGGVGAKGFYHACGCSSGSEPVDLLFWCALIPAGFLRRRRSAR